MLRDRVALHFAQEPGLLRFSDFRFPDPLNETLNAIGYVTPTPVQAEAIPFVLDGRDILATAQTGTGKTAAFALPLLVKILQGNAKPTLIVAPTRELAEQIGRVLAQLTEKTPQIKSSVIIGGLAYHQQIRSLQSKPMFVVGTPGRLIDQVQLGHLQLDRFGTLVIDEADRLLDMGFEPQMNALVARLPRDRQTLLFSATLPNEIVRLANSYLRNPERIAIGAVSKPVDKIKQDIVQTTAKDKDETLIREIDKVAGSLLVFTRTKWRTEKVAKLLSDAGHQVARIHGDRSQNQRSTAIANFRDGTVRILVATDIAARGIDIPHIQHVVNYDLPICPEDYIHRIGRTARAGAEGHSLAFVTPEEAKTWARIFKLLHGRLPDNFKNGNGSRQGHQGNGRPHPQGKKSAKPGAKAARTEASAPKRHGKNRWMKRKGSGPNPGQKNGQRHGQKVRH